MSGGIGSTDLETLIRLANWAAQNQHGPILTGVRDTIRVLYGNDALTERVSLNERLDFFNLISVIGTFKYTDQEAFISALALFDDIHKKYHDTIYNCAHISPIKWFPIRKMLLLHIGLSILLHYLNISDEIIDENLEFLYNKSIWECPAINYKSYVTELKETLQQLSFYANEDENNIDMSANSVHTKVIAYEDIFMKQDLLILVNILQTKRKETVSIQKIENILMNFKMSNIEHQMISYVKDLELKILNKPVLEINYVAPDEGVANISHLRDDEWTDEMARTSGPYKQKDERLSVSHVKPAARQSLSEKRLSGLNQIIAPKSSHFRSPYEDSHSEESDENQTQLNAETHETNGAKTARTPTIRSATKVEANSRDLLSTVEAFVSKNDKLDPLKAIEKDTKTSPSRKRAKTSKRMEPIEEPKRPQKKVTEETDSDGDDGDRDFESEEKRNISKRARRSLPKKLFPGNAVGDKVEFDDIEETSDLDADPNAIRGSKAVEILSNLSSTIPKKKKFADELEPKQRPARAGEKGARLRLKWTWDEQEALQQGVEMYGPSWSKIRDSYPIFNTNKRTNIDLKDKWRNMQKKRTNESLRSEEKGSDDGEESGDERPLPMEEKAN